MGVYVSMKDMISTFEAGNSRFPVYPDLVFYLTDLYNKLNDEGSMQLPLAQYNMKIMQHLVSDHYS